MGRHPKTDGIEQRLKRGNNFSLTRTEYITITGIDTPQDSNYTIKRSAVAKLAQKYGYAIQIIPEQLVFTKKGNEKIEN